MSPQVRWRNPIPDPRRRSRIPWRRQPFCLLSVNRLRKKLVRPARRPVRKLLRFRVQGNLPCNDRLGRPMSHEILIVEDDPALREALAQVLSDEGYELFSARDGLEAVNCLKKGNRPDVILLDLSMPVVNGWEFRMFQK